MAISRVTSSPLGFYHTIKINAGLGAPDEWLEEIEAIENCAPNDVLHLKINSPGGRLDTATEFLSAMNQCHASKIITEITGQCCSAATLIFLRGDEFIVNEGVEFMAHTASFGYGGKENNVTEYVMFQNKQVHSLVRTHYEGFFTEDEITEILKGGDKYLDKDQILDRLQERTFYLEEKELNSMEMEELREWSDTLNIEYASNATKKVLISKLMEYTRKQVQ